MENYALDRHTNYLFANALICENLNLLILDIGFTGRNSDTLNVRKEARVLPPDSEFI